LPQDIYDEEVAVELGLSLANLASASAFHGMLNISKKPQAVRYFFFAGTRQTTTHAIHVTRVADKRTIKKLDRDDAGDGTVPYWSASMTSVQTEPVGGEHGDIYKDSGLRHLLGNLLGKEGLLGAAGSTPELSVRDKVTHPEQRVQITLDLPDKTNEINGELRMRRKVNATGIEQVSPPWEDGIPILYKGPMIDHLTIVINAPSYTGIYQIAYFDAGNQVSTEIALFVQDVGIL
jgi:hypothetical protein